MNKEEFVSAIAKEMGSTKANAEKLINSFIDVVTNTLKKKEEINLIGFGKFYITERQAGKGKNPRTGEEVDIKASTSPKFKAGKGFKGKVNV